MVKSLANSQTTSTAARRKPARTKPDHPVTAYAKDVVEGRTVTGRLVRLACKRHLDDLRKAKREGWRFNEGAADHALDFFPEFLIHGTAPWKGRPFKLAPWETFIVGSLFGWQEYVPPKDRGLVGRAWVRRFRDAYIETARKQGKSFLAAGLGDYCLVAAGEDGAEIYCSATRALQSKVVFDLARKAVLNSPELRAAVKVERGGLYVVETGSKFEPLNADRGTDDGSNVFLAIVDEYHAHKTRDQLDVLRSGMGARLEPILFIITTAGKKTVSPCREEHDHAVRVLEGLDEGRGQFVYIAALDPDDDWTDETKWFKANPNLGVTVLLRDLRKECKAALEFPSAQNEFKCKRLNMWVQATSRWISSELWRAGNLPLIIPEKLAGRECYAGLDLGMTHDLSALVLWFPPTKEELEAATEKDPAKHKLLPFFWLPGEGLAERCHRDKVPYDQWVREGLIALTPGNAIDFDFIRKAVNDQAGVYQIRELCYDPFSSRELAQGLAKDGFKILSITQAASVLSEPTMEFERLLRVRQIGHGGNKVLTWMMDCAVIVRDEQGRIKLAKPKDAKSPVRVDGVAAAIFACDRVIRNRGKAPAKRPVNIFL